MTREEQLLEAAGEIDDCARRLSTAYVALRDAADSYARDAARQGGPSAAGDVAHITNRVLGEVAGRLAATSLKPIFYTSSAPAPVDDLSALWVERLASGKLTTARPRPSGKWAPLPGQSLPGQGTAQRTEKERWGR